MSFGLLRGDIFDFGKRFVALVAVEMKVDDLELEVGVVVRLVWDCLNGMLYFLRHFSRMSQEGKMSSVVGSPLGTVKQENFFMELLFFDGGCLWKVAASKMSGFFWY